jgi:hypothetical protein
MKPLSGAGRAAACILLTFIATIQGANCRAMIAGNIT